MTKSIKKSDVSVQTVEELAESIHTDLGDIWHELGKNKKGQALVEQTWEKVKQLMNVNNDLSLLYASAQAAAQELARQRDIAIHDARTWKRCGEELFKRAVAGQMAVDGGIPVNDVLLVLDVLSGKKTTFEEPRLQELYEMFKELGNALLEEQLLSGEDE